jgi:hypothetical protein
MGRTNVSALFVTSVSFAGRNSMETKCPHCTRLQTIPDGQEDVNVRCENCRGIFPAKHLPKISPIRKAVDWGLPQFSHWGPGWWLTSLAILGVVVAVVMALGYGLPAALPGLMFAGSTFGFALIINYLGYIASLLEYGLTSKKRPE